MINVRLSRHGWRLRPGRLFPPTAAGLATTARRARARWLRPGRLGALALAGLAAATGLLLSDGGPARAAGVCPSVNRPNMLRVAGGSPQTAQLEKPFQTNLQVELANSNGCPLTGRLAGFWVDFTAPATGPTGTFATSGTNHVTVGTDATGVATAPTFTANDTAGAYTVQADSDYGSALFYLSNTASGVPASITTAGTGQNQSVNSQYAQPLQAQILDANGRPVQGVTVTFSLGTGPSGAGASFLGGGAQASETTNANGEAISPLFVANGKTGRFTATASISGNVPPATYSLQNLAGPPASMTAGAASGEATPIGTRFPIPLAVTVTDADENPVAGVVVTFAAPARGPSGHFGPGAGARRSVRVKTNSKGIAVAPALVANSKPGGYVATATAAGLHAAFALINQPKQ
jgi:hypothetical protein